MVSVNVDQDGAMSVKGGEYMPWSGNKDASVVVNTYKNADGTQAAKLSDEELQKVHQAKTGFRQVLAPSAGRTTLGIMGTAAPQNVCASAGSSDS